ncbi:MAG TPA: AbrB/MazE/SpoVT family DNA-binding domain-containing protein [Azospirillaceae bacterium]|nr:AbrB/MazE/SpoVT family DNA-binding domain-containing protein [Azospirillaceae bacterium]
MGTMLTVTAKGQVTLRKEVLEHLGVSPGDKLVVELMPDGKVQVGPAPRGSIESFFGSLAVPPGTPPVSIEEMNQAIAAGWAGDAKPWK